MEKISIRLATQIGSRLTGVCILDEPSIGLHQRDNERLLQTLRELTDLGNTLLVVEHDEDTSVKQTGFDLGPGQVGRRHRCANGPPKKVMKAKDSVTGAYLSGRRSIKPPSERPLQMANGWK